MRMQSIFDTLVQSWEKTCPGEYTTTQFLDLTLLDLNACDEDILSLQESGLRHQVKALCVYPTHLPLLHASSLTRATVVNFPHGTAGLKDVIQDIEQAKKWGADEIDYVFPWQAWLSDDTTNSLHHCKTIVNHTHMLGLKIKVILETGAFQDFSSIINLSRHVIDTECDFLKTSTGKTGQGASLGAAFAILTAIFESGSRCGIKLSGGIRTKEAACTYLKLCEFIMKKKATPDWVRIGSSTVYS